MVHTLINNFIGTTTKFLVKPLEAAFRGLFRHSLTQVLLLFVVLIFILVLIFIILVLILVFVVFTLDPLSFRLVFFFVYLRVFLH